jgi:hypothetical protein
MTERKPTGMTFRTWIDQQISEAAERGAFDNLPGAGKPLPKRGEDDDGQAWVRDYLRREGVSTDVLLPTPLKLRKEAATLAETAPAFRSEQDVREAVAELNHRIMEWRRIPLGPPIFVPLVDEEAMVAAWRPEQPSPSQAGPPKASPAAQPTASPAAQPTASPAAQPTASPAAQPTASPAVQPTAAASAGGVRSDRSQWWRRRRPARP